MHDGGGAVAPPPFLTPRPRHSVPGPSRPTLALTNPLCYRWVMSNSEPFLEVTRT